ncbi:unnamed protein product [Discosporangium mesarthrocarpum]
MDDKAEESANLPAPPPYSQVADKFGDLEADASRCGMDEVGCHLLKDRMAWTSIHSKRKSRQGDIRDFFGS